jgi:hypothetical protein
MSPNYDLFTINIPRIIGVISFAEACFVETFSKSGIFPGTEVVLVDRPEIGTAATNGRRPLKE